MVRGLAAVLVALGCASESVTTVPITADGGDVAPAPAEMSPTALAVRLSIDLRGVRPTPEELLPLEGLNTLEAADAALQTLVDDFLRDPRFPKRVRDLWAPVFRTRVEDFPVPSTALGLTPEEQPALYASIGEEPLQVVARVADEDLPWTELVTGNWTMVDDTLAAHWPVEREGSGGWTPAQYTDRPAAGLLSVNGLWWRYLSDGVSYGRGRANAVARIFLCADFLDRPVDFPRELDLTDEAAIKAAVRENTGCVGCHSALDPLAGYLAGLQYADLTGPELIAYHPEREREWGVTTESHPAFYGEAGYSLADLGRQLAADPRYVQCAVERSFEMLTRRKPDLWALTRHREAFLAGGLTLRSLLRSIVRDPAYRDATAERLITPEIWGDQLEAWTGYRLVSAGADLLGTDRTGLRSLAGGGDGRAGSNSSEVPTTTMALVWQRTAEAAAAYAAANPEESGLFEVDPSVPGEPESLGAQLRAWHLRLHGRPMAEDGVAATSALWDTLAAMDGPRAAWAGVLTALLRDPELLVY